MKKNVMSVVCAGLVTCSLTAAPQPPKAQDTSGDKELAAYMKAEEQRYVKDHSVRAAIEDGKMFGIMIEGEIKDGDYNAFVNLVKDLKGAAINVYLYSPGGSALEAMKIGRLIRRLKLHTIVPMISPTHPFCGPAKPAFAENCTCESACFLIHVAGIERMGDVLGIHRVYVAHEVLKNLSSAEAVKASDDIKKTLTAYLFEMGVPNAYTERVLAIPSGKIEFLTEQEIGRDFSGYIPEYQEWVTAKCGDMSSLYDEETRVMKASKFRDTALTLDELKAVDKDYRLIWDKIDKASDCRRSLDKSLVAEAYQTFR